MALLTERTRLQCSLCTSMTSLHDMDVVHPNTSFLYEKHVWQSVDTLSVWSHNLERNCPHVGNFFVKKQFQFIVVYSFWWPDSTLSSVLNPPFIDHDRDSVITEPMISNVVRTTTSTVPRQIDADYSGFIENVARLPKESADAFRTSAARINPAGSF